MMTSSSDSTTLFEFKPGKHVSIAALRAMLPDVETALFFGKVYELDYTQLSQLLSKIFDTNLMSELLSGEHSTELQDYIVGIVPDYLYPEDAGVSYTDSPSPGTVLPEVWASLEVEVSKSLKDVAEKLADTLDLLPGKEGQMVFRHMSVLNRQRPVIGDFRAGVQHARQVQNLVVLDVSGSMSEHTVRTIIDDVVALSYKANAHLAIVSTTATHWEPGAYDANVVMQRAEFSGTHYEQLTPLLHRDWGTVITIADYDSSADAKRHISQSARGRIDTVLDISLVNRPTFLSECLGTIAREVRPILIGQSYYVTS